MTVRGVPVLQYDGLGTSLPAGVAPPSCSPVANLVTVLRDTTAAQFGAILARRTQTYLGALARVLIARPPQRVTRKLRLADYDGEVSPRGV